MTAPQASWDALAAAIAEDARVIGWLSERIGHVFAQAQSLHTTDFRALHAIYCAARDGAPLTSKALAAELQLSPAAITYVVARLAESGHVARHEDPTDRRRVILQVDEPGLDVARSFFGPLGQAHVAALRSFSKEELDVAHRVLTEVIGVLGVFEGAVRDAPPVVADAGPGQIDSMA